MTMIMDFMAGRTPPQLYTAYLAEGLFAPWAEALLATSAPGRACLDLACGTGVVARKLAASARVDSVAAIDVSELMIAEARSNAGAPAEQIDYRVASALDLPFDDDVFDAAYCQQGLQFFPDRVRALTECRRVLKTGSGRLAAAVWTAASDGNPVFAAFEACIADAFGADLLPLGPFSFPDAGELRAAFEEAGFAMRSLERREMTAMLPDARTLVLFDLLFLGRPGADGALAPVVHPEDPTADEKILALIADLDARLGAYRQADGTLRAPTAAHLVVAEA